MTSSSNTRLLPTRNTPAGSSRNGTATDKGSISAVVMVHSPSRTLAQERDRSKNQSFDPTNKRLPVQNRTTADPRIGQRMRHERPHGFADLRLNEQLRPPASGWRRLVPKLVVAFLLVTVGCRNVRRK